MNGEVITTITNNQEKSLHFKRVSEDYICVQNPIDNYDGSYSANISFYDNNFNLCSTIENSELNFTDFTSSNYVSKKIGVVKLRYDEVLVDYSIGKIITPKYIEIGKFDDEKAFALDEDFNLHIIDINGNVLKSYDNLGRVCTPLTINIVISRKSDTFRLYNRDGEDIFNERFYNYYVDRTDKTDNYMLIENVEGNYALINGYGEIIFDFGTITEDTIYGYTKSKEFYNNDMYCAVVDNGDSNTVYAYIN